MSTEPLVITLVGRPPSWNSAYRARKSYIYMTREAKSWKKLTTLITSEAVKAQNWSCQRDTMLIVDVWIYVKRTIDADNILKLTLDAVAAGLGINDARFLPRVWELNKKCDDEKIVLSVTEVANDD
ncbi:MAG: RusA family crossover junction endodeoxyribonuclease [Actinobacteria bacterium]|nr:RusA family crossover junction endodeoxyribonuclease [Actinomycetota bacterium]